MRLLEFTEDVDTVDQGEYDREGDMAIGQLNTIDDAADELRSILSADDNLPEWVQNKITKAVDYIDTARDYMKSKEQGVAEELSIKHQRDHSTQHYPDTSNSLATRSVSQAELPNVYKTADGHPTVRGRFHGKAAQTRVNPTITPTSVNRKDSSGPIPAFLKKGVAEEITADDMAQSAHAQGLKHGREGSGNNMDRAKAQHGENFKHYNAGFLKGRNEKAKRLKVFGQGNNKRQQGVAEANGRRYSSYNDELSSRERDEQNYMDQSKSDFKRAEMQHELGHEDDPNFERNLRQQQLERDQGPWYIRIDGKIYRQSGQPKVFDLKNGANNYALAMIKNNPSLQGKVTLSKSEADR